MRLRISIFLLFAVFSLSLAADTITVVSGSNAVFSRRGRLQRGSPDRPSNWKGHRSKAAHSRPLPPRCEKDRT